MPKMFSKAKAKKSSEAVLVVPPTEKPWVVLMGAIDSALEKIKAAFELAFADGHKLPTEEKQPKELIRLLLLRDIWVE